jgi:Holliday junction resolvase RusA-like endonuclease
VKNVVEYSRRYMDGPKKSVAGVVIREISNFFLKVMVEAHQITIQGSKCPSLNDVLNKHWRTAGEIKKTMEELIYWSLMEITCNWEKIKTPINIRIEAHYAGNNRHDSDNIFDKPIIDAIVKANIIPDDDCDFVFDVTSRAYKRQKANKIFIFLESVKQE